MAETPRLQGSNCLSASDVNSMTEDELLSVCDQKGIKLGDDDDEPDIGSYRAALLKYISPYSAQELRLDQAAARFKERHSQQKSEVMSMIDLVESFMNDSDVKHFLSNLDIPSRILWITDDEFKSNSGITSKRQWEIDETFKRMRAAISEVVPVLLVAGPVSSGKSSLLNAFLGKKILPVSHNATTAVTCELRYTREDGKKTAVVHFDNGKETLDLDDEQDLKKFQEYVTKRKNHRISRSTSEDAEVAAADPDKYFCNKVEIFWPLEFLKDITLVDSPGVIDEEDMKTIRKQCGQQTPCGFIFVLDAMRSAQEAAKAGGLLHYILKVTNGIPAPGSALFVANKWDSVQLNVVTVQAQEQIREKLLEKLAEEWPGFQRDQMITMSCQPSGVPEAGPDSHDMEMLCRGIQNALTDGSDHVLLSAARSCLDLIELIADSVERTVYSFNMPIERRLTKGREERERCENQRHDYEHGQLGKRLKLLMDKIQETAKALKIQLESKSQCQAIIEQAKAQSEHEGFFASRKGDMNLCGAEEFATKCLQKAITNADEYKEVKQWATDTLMVEKACYDVKLLLPAFERKYSTQNRRVDLQVNYIEESFNWVFFVVHSLLLAPVNFPGLVWCSLTRFRSETAIKLVPSFHVTNWAEKASFVSSVLDTYTATVHQLVSNNEQQLKILLQQFLIRDVTSVRILIKDIPEHIKEEENKLSAQASREEKDKHCYQSILHRAKEIWNQLATTVLTLNVHIWPSESVHMSCIPDVNHADDMTLATGSFHDALIKTGEKACLMLIDLKMNEILSKTIALAAVLPRVRLDHKNVVSVYGSVLLDPNAMKLGLLFEPFAKQPITDELFAPDREFKIEKASQLALNVSHAVCYLHKNDLVLRGFSSDNLKKAANGTVKLLPPPYGKQLWHTTSCLEGSFHDDLAYAAPEVLYHWLCDEKADIYSMGILLAEIWDGHRAYSKSRETRVPETGTTFAHNILSETLRPSKFLLPTTGSRLVGQKDTVLSMRMPWHNLAVECWKSDPSARPNAEEVRQRLTEAATRALPPPS